MNRAARSGALPRAWWTWHRAERREGFFTGQLAVVARNDLLAMKKKRPGANTGAFSLTKFVASSAVAAPG